MDKSILLQYKDAEELIAHTRQQIRRLKMEKEAVLSDTVKGSNPNYPYEQVTFRITGFGSGTYSDADIRKLEKILQERQVEAARLRVLTEEWVNTIPARMRLVVQLRYFNGLSWSEVATKMGRGITPDGIRMEFRRFMSGAGYDGDAESK